MSSPAGQVQQFVPDLPQILASTRLLEPGQSITIQFRAPGQAGERHRRWHRTLPWRQKPSGWLSRTLR